MDTMFQTQELERFLQKQAIPIRWEDGVYDRLLLGQRGGRFDPEAPPLKSCRVWQLTRDSPINMRFIPYEALLERFGQPDRKHYETVYDGLVGTNDPEEIYTLFRDPVPGYDGRPIGISDVLELYDADGSEFYYVIVDCGSYIANDILSAVALMEADSILRLANCDPKSVNYFASQLPLLDGPEWDMDKQYKVASNVKPYQAADHIGKVLGDTAFVLPYSQELEEQYLAGNLLADLALKDSRPFRKELERIIAEVF